MFLIQILSLLLAMQVGGTGASDESRTKTPVEVSLMSIEPHAIARAAGVPVAYDLKAKNLDAKEIIGQVIVISFLNSEGKSRGSVTVKTAQFDDQARRFLPGTTLPMRPVHAPITKDNESLTPKVEVDYILFADMTGWGPDTLKMSKELISFVNGARAARGAGRR